MRTRPRHSPIVKATCEWSGRYGPTVNHPLYRQCPACRSRNTRTIGQGYGPPYVTCFDCHTITPLPWR